MSFLNDDQAVGGQLMVGAGIPVALGFGPQRINGSAYIEGPQIVGSANEFPAPIGTLMVGPLTNTEAKSVPISGAQCGGNFSPYSLVVSGDAAIFDNLSVNANVITGGDVTALGEVK